MKKIEQKLRKIDLKYELNPSKTFETNKQIKKTVGNCKIIYPIARKNVEKCKEIDTKYNKTHHNSKMSKN